MTQGYGAGSGQQPQWGPAGQTPPPAPQNDPWGQQAPGQQSAPGQQPAQDQQQWGQQQWGQASPSSVPSYPGASGYPGAAGHQSGVGGAPDGVNWRTIKTLGLILLVCTGLLLLARGGIDLAGIISAADVAESQSGSTPSPLAAGAGLVVLLLFLGNVLIGLIMVVVGIIAAVKGREWARKGGIAIAVAIPVFAILYWVVTFIAGFIAALTGMTDPITHELTTGAYRLLYAADLLRNLVLVGLLGFCSWAVFNTARKKLSA